MNIKKFTASVLAFSLLCLCACNKPSPEAETTSSATVQASTTAAITLKETTTETTATTTTSTTKLTESVDFVLGKPTGKSFVIRKPQFETHRGLLPKKLQTYYDDYFEKIINYEFFVVDFKSDGINIDEFYEITDSIRSDYNEIRLFLKTSELYSDEVYNGDVRYISVSYEYNWLIRDTFDPEYMNSYMDEINAVCDEIISRMPNGTNAEKYEFLGREIVEITYYGENDINNVPDEEVDWSYVYINGPLLNGKAICQGYAYAYMYLCNRAGLWCHTVSGGGHCWNIVKLEDGSTYHVDLTWADSGNDFEDYFLLTQEETEEDHTINEDALRATGKPIQR